MTTTADRSTAGRLGRRLGKDTERPALRWLRDHGAPHAEHVTRGHASDVTGVGDVAIEITAEEWGSIGKKARQAEFDAAERAGAGQPAWDWCVWKRRRGYPDPGEWWCVQPFGQWWRLRQRVTELEQEVLVLRRIIRADAPDGGPYDVLRQRLEAELQVETEIQEIVEAAEEAAE